MNSTKFSFLLLFLSSFVFSSAQNHQSRFEKIDVQHYKFEIHLNDTTNHIEGFATISTKFLQPSNDITLDLVDNTGDNGMLVHSVKKDGNELEFNQAHNKLGIHLNEQAQTGDVIDFTVAYSGIPADGLIISENRYGDRTFFGDNWPDRAQNWLPCVDHPSDKATLEFLVYAPAHYEVIANGSLVEKKELENSMEFTHWKEDVPLSTKLMVIGAADFAVGNNQEFQGIPVSSWVFEENKTKGFLNYQYGTKALEYFSELIGPYSYEKLAHVQSKTRYGGMENASCIFYFENSAISDRIPEQLFAHEVAHQWFGNSVTEQNWHHVWLSEGFATYLTHLYVQHFYGDEQFKVGLKQDRERVIGFSKQKYAPIIDTTVQEYTRLLNANSYEKAAWFLHMLRNKLGDDTFFKGLQKYYHDYRNKTALTKDFQSVMESVSGKDLDRFFNQWLWNAGHPIIKVSWGTETTGKQIDDQQILIQQGGKQLFSFPLEMNVLYEDGSVDLLTVMVDKTKRTQQFQANTTSGIKDIIIDPNVKLLYELAQ
ncbi:M1 family metallopeptidase [uncultured Draconibacterium sp.]|uniref:M1 family metallopeptidase n=1 Tax=uncultured Draconibacterium sp. TaxID=1573823 RepID=UPI0025F0A272|nr:M1 family metallopeptidase [uncultured Draconibacterium sp.]